MLYLEKVHFLSPDLSILRNDVVSRYSLMFDWRVLAVLLISLGCVDCLRTRYRKGLSALPGPFIATYSSLYRLSMVCNGDGPAQYRQIHEKYGKLVRVGPNHVSISDPSAIPVIYGIGSQFTKVGGS